MIPKYGIDSCPLCGTTDMMMQESKHLFICEFCHNLFLIRTYIDAGRDMLRIAFCGTWTLSTREVE